MVIRAVLENIFLKCSIMSYMKLKRNQRNELMGRRTRFIKKRQKARFSNSFRLNGDHFQLDGQARL
jgi:hypothetical protein